MKVFFLFSMAVILLTGTVSWASGALPAGTTGVESSRPLADRLLGELFSAYQNGTRQDLEDRVSEDFMPGRAEFLRDAAQGAREGAILEMNYTLDGVSPSRGKLVVSFSWEKKVHPAGGSDTVLLSGEAGAVFKNEDGVWRLAALTGDSPF
jgi:hypothetical protein